MIRAFAALVCLAAPASAQSVCDLAPDAFVGEWQMDVTAEYSMHDGAVQETMGQPRSLIVTVEMSGDTGILIAPFGGGTAIIDLATADPSDDLGPLPDAFDGLLSQSALPCSDGKTPALALTFARDFPGGASGMLNGRVALLAQDRAVGLQVITLTDPERGSARLVSRFDLTR